MLKRLALILPLTTWLATSSAARAELVVVTSIKPVFALTAMVMGDLGRLHLLLDGAQSPHNFALRPSHAKAIANADLIFWIGPELETFLEKAITRIAHKARSIALINAEGMTLYPWEADDGHGHADDHGPDVTDPHIWLDPENARVMLAAIRDALLERAPEHRAVIDANFAKADARLVKLSSQIAATLKPVQSRGYLVFHEAYRYFEKRFGLSPKGALSLNPANKPGPSKIRDLQDQIDAEDIACVFTEPQFSRRLVEVVTEGSRAKTGVLDPLGANIDTDKAAYEETLKGLAFSFRSCLE